MLRHMCPVYAVACDRATGSGREGERQEERGETMDMRKRPYRGGRGLLLAAAISGGVTAYFADPARGKERRDRAIDRLRGAFNVAADRTQEWRRRVAARAWSKPPQ